SASGATCSWPGTRTSSTALRNCTAPPEPRGVGFQPANGSAGWKPAPRSHHFNRRKSPCGVFFTPGRPPGRPPPGSPPAGGGLPAQAPQDTAPRAAVKPSTERTLRLPKEPYRYANLELPAHFNTPGARRFDNTPRDNPVTDVGATLGRVLFHDTRFSANNTVS